MSHQNNQHAARLRDMAAGNRRWAIAYKYETDPISQIRLNSLHEDAAALLAGAEALEAVEVAKAALLKVRDHARPTHREDAYEVCYDWCPLCAVTAALARLEGK
jgi:hypothetical protein